MPTQRIDEKLPVVGPGSGTGEEKLRELAIEQIERKRHFHMRAFSAAAATVVLVVIWAISEYHNAGGWPSDGFSQSSSIPHVWNIWIIYPVIGLALFVAIDAWNTYRKKPISEQEVRQEMDRLIGSG